jgi:CRISPR-associated protein Cas1
MLNKKELKAKDFSLDMSRCLLKEGGRKIFVKAFEERLNKQSSTVDLAVMSVISA